MLRMDADPNILVLVDSVQVRSANSPSPLLLSAQYVTEPTQLYLTHGQVRVEKTTINDERIGLGTNTIRPKPICGQAYSEGDTKM